jgi:60 kDa SS-A/Ro ribonucleoprotein
MDVYLAFRVYNSGWSQPDRRAEGHIWTPVAEISDALEEAYELSFGHVQRSGKRMLVAVDSSGSMSGAWGWGQLTLGGSPLGSPYEVGCAMAAVLKRIEGGNVHVIDVDTQVHPSRITTRTRVREIGSWRPSGGGTDLSLPFTRATKHKMEVDGFALFTDGETWAGRQHVSQALATYRREYKSGARVVLASMVAVGHSIAEPEDAGVLDIGGMDAALPMVATGSQRTCRIRPPVPHARSAVQMSASSRSPRAMHSRSARDSPCPGAHLLAAHSASVTVTASTWTP